VLVKKHVDVTPNPCSERPLVIIGASADAANEASETTSLPSNTQFMNKANQRQYANRKRKETSLGSVEEISARHEKIQCGIH
jgi:hypothetical protein